MYIEGNVNPLSTAAVGNRLIIEGFYNMYYQELSETPSTFEKIVEIRESDKRFETDFEFVGLTMAQARNIGQGVEYEAPLDGGTKSITHTSYAKGVQFTQEDMDDDLYGVLVKVSKELPKTITRRVESVNAGNVAGVFSTTTGFDGLALCSTAHTFPNGRADVITGATTWSNRLAIDSALSPESLTSLMVLLAKQKSREGMPVDMEPDTLLIPPDLMPRASQIMKSMYQPFTDTNEVGNFGPGGIYKLKIVEWKWLPSTTMYLVLDSKNTPFYHYWRERPFFNKETDYNSRVQKFTCGARFSAGASEPRGFAGTPGA